MENYSVSSSENFEFSCGLWRFNCNVQNVQLYVQCDWKVTTPYVSLAGYFKKIFGMYR